MALAVWSSIPPSARIIILAMLTAESVRHPASSFWSAPEAALAS
jgi:TRAP-type C4-dicarboxylate transport system permease large subunit